MFVKVTMLEDYFALAQHLEQHHVLFQQFWQLGQPCWDTQVSTAEVRFNPQGTVSFSINPNFWASLSLPQKSFLIAHEFLHIILDHGTRIISCTDRKLANIAADLVVNHLLIEKFGFNREEIDPCQQYCWLDTVFPQEQVASHKSFEFYYQLLIQHTPSWIPMLVNTHDNLFESDKIFPFFSEESQICSQQWQSHGQQVGTLAGLESLHLSPLTVKPKRKWESVVTRWSHQHHKEHTIEQWAKLDRRRTLWPTQLALPSDLVEEKLKKDKLDVWAFQDVSGSCRHFSVRFFKAFASLPVEKFNVKLHCFDTKVYSVNKNNPKLRGFGGTSFRCLDEYVRKTMAAQRIVRHPAIWILTDGLGECMIKPTHPQHWYWFLSYNYTSCIPSGSRIFKLKDFE